ncbi:hypothetical protein E8E13_001992 [Curvularia kusanoi]|uniref:SAP domain-containing protein n=1 Tax=Curvularia kusanoi TaxID=90978 RepID=A0A9P4T3W3_CURKU|nr:hypothetical protein E8E13_001992 [Curvularia kusanoi]
MADYNKQTVAQLRQLLKDRGIASTGLTRKAQIIEKLEEADNASAEAPGESDAPAEAAADAQQPESAEAQSEQGDGAPGPPLEEAGDPVATVAETRAEAEPTPVPAPTADRSPETISHIDSDVPPPDHLKAIEQPAEDTTAQEEVGGPQPTQVFRAAPAAPEDDQVGPHITEPTDEEAEAESGDGNKEVENDELPEAPGPAAEALRVTQLGQDRSGETRDVTMEVGTPSPAPNERDTIEKAELLPIPERSTAETSRLNSEELEADTRKRRRRSNSPDISKEVLAKKARLSQEPAPNVHLTEDEDVTMEQRRPEYSPPDPKRGKTENVSRYKDLVQPSSNQSAEVQNDDRPTIPAIHPVTSALYIRNFMRPLRPEPLRTHLVSLASPPSSSPDPSIISALFLDNMKTHALALFTSTTAASRVRASLHGAIWPPEGNRKELWVDFIPSDKVSSWISTEEAALAAEKDARSSGRPIPTKRFEVVYSEDTDGTVTATHQELGAASSTAPTNAPRGPRASISDHASTAPPLPLAPTEALQKDTSASFKTLHDLFASTTTKPQLFYLPVSDAVSATRLKELQLETSRDWNPEAVRKGRGMQREAKFRALTAA